MGTRVLKSQVDAVLEALPVAKAALALTGQARSFAEVVAEAALTADTPTRYVIAARQPSGAPLVFGPYLTASAAEKAAAANLPVDAGAQARILPLIPHPNRKAAAR